MKRMGEGRYRLNKSEFRSRIIEVLDELPSWWTVEVAKEDGNTTISLLDGATSKRKSNMDKLTGEAEEIRRQIAEKEKELAALKSQLGGK